MPSWNEIIEEFRPDSVRLKYLRKLHDYTDRNVIIYYSAWLQKPNLEVVHWIADDDINGFMATIHKLDKSKGLDLIIHTPGGEVTATEAIVKYLRSVFGNNYRVIIPQLALSAGTMIACSANKIVMGKQSSIGPYDPQLGQYPAQGIVEEFDRIYNEVIEDENRIVFYEPLLEKYPPGIYGIAVKAIELSHELVSEWLKTNMFENMDDQEDRINRIKDYLGDHDKTKSHGRHISKDKASELGLIVENLEDDQALQDLVLSVHHATMITLQTTNSFKIIENHTGKGHIRTEIEEY